MTGDITELRYWIDLAIKAAIGVVVSIIGLDYRNVKSSLQELQEYKYRMASEVQIVQAELGLIKQRLERMERKLDEALAK
jgi:hypothetical protein